MVRMITIEVVVFFASFAFFQYNPIFHQLLFKNLCKTHFNTTGEECYSNKTINQHIQKESSRWIMWINWFQIVPVVLATLNINYAATRFSPDKLLFLPFVSFLAKMVLGICFNFYPTLPLFIYATISGVYSCFGGMSAFGALTIVYVTHTTNRRQRSSRFIAVEAVQVFSKFTGGLLSGFMIKYFSFLVPQLASVGVISLALVLSFFLTRAIPPNMAKSIDFKNFKSALKKTRKSIAANRTNFVLITLAQIALPFGEVSTQKLVFLYSMNSKFEFTSTLGGYLLAMYSLTRAFGSLVVLPVLLKYFQINEWKLCMAITPIQSGFYLANAFAKNRKQLFIAPFFLSLQDIYRPVFMATISRFFAGQARAIVFAFQIIISSLAASTGEILITHIYRLTIDTFPGIVFLVFGSVSIVATVIGTVGVYLSKRPKLDPKSNEKCIVEREE